MAKILIVDDDADTRNMMWMVLDARAGSGPYQVDMARNGREAIVMWGASGPYDLLLTDWHMPDVDGPTLCAWLRARNAAVPILLASDQEPAPRTLPTGIGFLRKPFGSEDLFQAVSRALGGRSETPPHVGTPPAPPSAAAPP